MRAMFTWCRERLGIVETKQNRRMLKKKRRDKEGDKQEGEEGGTLTVIETALASPLVS